MENQQAGFFILIVGVVICLAAIAVLIWDKRRKYKYTESVKGPFGAALCLFGALLMTVLA